MALLFLMSAPPAEASTKKAEAGAFPPPSLLAQEVLPAVARSLPRSSSVLLLTSIPFPIPYPLYFYPRSCKVLWKLLPGTGEALRRDLDPQVAERVTRYLAELRARGWLLPEGGGGEDSLLAAAREADEVLLFGFVGTFPKKPWLVKRASYPWGALYEVRNSKSPGEGR